MKDRTLIILGILVLVLNVGAGVTWALNSGSDTFGRQLGPSPRELINETAPRITGAVEFGRVKFEVFVEQGLDKIQNRISDLVNSARNKNIAQKNE